MDTPPTFLASTNRYWAVKLSVNAFTETQLLLLTFVTGLQNAICFTDFRAFAPAQTGNTVVLAISLAGGKRTPTCLNVGVSLASWLIGAMITGRMGSTVGRRRRVWQVGVGLVQTCMVLCAGFIHWKYGIGHNDRRANVCIALLASACGSQIAAGRAWAVPEISTAMATACWVDLLIDDRLFARDNRPRNRRVLFLLTLVMGTLVGAFAKDWVGSPEVVLFSGVLKALVVVAMSFTPGEQADLSTKPL